MNLHTFSLYDFIRHNAEYAPDAAAIISPDGVQTHAQFRANVDRLAAGLAEQGLQPGDRVAILAQNSPAYLELIAACARNRAIAYPINWRLTAHEVREVLALAEAQLLVVGEGHLPQLEETDPERLPARFWLGDAPPEGFRPLADLYRDPDGVRFPDIQPADPCVVISTAAVAGVPRGALLTHANFVWAGYQLIAALGLTAQDRHLAALPFFHITGLGLSLAVMQAGGANVVLPRFDPALAVQMINRHTVTLLADFPPVLSMLLDARQQAGASLDSLRYVLGLDAPDVIQRLYAETQARFWTGFGQSETSGLVTLQPVDEKPGAAGRPLPVVRLRCVDEDGNDVPAGQPGEIAVQGPLVFAGYWRDPDATAFTFRHGWHHTGDLGKLDEAGYLYYVGRKPEKELIKSGGENVYPEEVERVLRELPEVAAVCVIGVPDPKWGEAVKAVIELAPGANLTEEQVVEAVVARIASYKKPRQVAFVAALPRTEEGKVDRAAVKKKWGGG